MTREEGCGPFHVFNYALAFASQVRKITEKLSQSSRKVLGTVRCEDMAAFYGQPRMTC